MVPLTAWMYANLYTVILLASFVTGQQSTPPGALAIQVKWDMSPSYWDPKDEGSDVTIKCVVRNLLSPFAAVSIERSAGGRVTLVSTNQVVEDPFRDEVHEGRRRYSVRFELLQASDGYIANVGLTIKKIKSEDAGRFRCKSEGEQTELVTLAVRVPVEEVYMRMFYPNNTSFNDSVPVPDGTTVTLREKRRSGVACSVVMRSELIQPEVRLTSGGRLVSGLFSLSGPTPVEGAARPTWMYQYSVYTLSPHPELHDHTLSCSAYTLGYEQQNMSASVDVLVEFRPRIMCFHYEYYGHVGGSVTMACAVKSNPMSQIVFRFGFFLSDNVYNVSSPFMTDGRYIFTRTEEKGGISNVTVTLKDIRNAHFQYTYKMDCMNSYGSTSATLILYEGRTVGASNHVIPSLLGRLLLVALISTWLTICPQR